MPIASTDSRSCPAGRGTPRPTSGRRVLADSWTTSNATVDARVPQSYTVDGYQLGAWVTTQRTNHAKGTLDADREHRLEEAARLDVGPQRRPVGGGFPAASWITSNATVTPASRSPTRDWLPAGRGWPSNADYSGQGTLDLDRQHRLEDLPGWTWNGRRDAIWEEGFRRSLDYVERNGDALVPKRYKGREREPARCVGYAATEELCGRDP